VRRRYFEKIPGKKTWKRIERDPSVAAEELGDMEDLLR